MARRPSTKDGIADLIAFFREPRPHQWLVLGLAVLFPAIIVGLFLASFRFEQEYVPPEVTYVTQWDASRSRAEIMAQQAKDLPKELAERERIRKAEEERRQQYRRVADMMGIEVDRK